MKTAFRVLSVASLVMGAAILHPSTAAADSCKIVHPFCRQCIPDNSGACCMNRGPCGCIYVMCLSAGVPATSPVSTLPDIASFLQEREAGTDRPAAPPSAACQLSTPAGALLATPRR
jgi:hypothetical protein